jgi:signal transduction histidine kinase
MPQRTQDVSAVGNGTPPKIGGSGRPLRVLIVEDSPPDALLLARALERGGFALTWKRVDARHEMETALEHEHWDLVLSDHAMPQFSAPEALRLVKGRGLDLPFIIVSGFIDEATALEAMRAGAHDYVTKDRLARLLPVVERELREAEVRRAHRQNERELRRAHEELELRVQKRTADLHAAYLKLHGAMEERRRLENELLEIAENERRRIGFDLHDDLGQKLTGVSMLIKGLEQRLAAERHPCAAETGQIHALVNEVITHMHDLAHDFSSLNAQGDDLASVLGGLAENVENMFRIPCKLEIEGAIPAMPSHASMQFYKIAQEAVSNAVKHGKARHVLISVKSTADKFTLSIKNDGLPFATPLNSKDRLGLRIMNYRANTIGATVDIMPQRRGGALMTCVMPVNTAATGAQLCFDQVQEAA